jgi:hypothetical protein
MHGENNIKLPSTSSRKLPFLCPPPPGGGGKTVVYVIIVFSRCTRPLTPYWQPGTTALKLRITLPTVLTTHSEIFTSLCPLRSTRLAGICNTLRCEATCHTHVIDMRSRLFLRRNKSLGATVGTNASCHYVQTDAYPLLHEYFVSTGVSIEFSSSECVTYSLKINYLIILQKRQIFLFLYAQMIHPFPAPC